MQKYHLDWTFRTGYGFSHMLDSEESCYNFIHSTGIVTHPDIIGWRIRVMDKDYNFHTLQEVKRNIIDNE